MKASIRLDRAVELFVAAQKRRGCTERWSEDTARNLGKWLVPWAEDAGRAETGAMDGMSWDDWREWLMEQEGSPGSRGAGKPLASSSVKKYLSCAKKFSAWLFKRGYLPEEPYINEYDLEPEMPTPDRFLPYASIRELWAALSEDQSWEGLRDLALFKLQYSTAGRLGEVLALDRRDVDFQGQVVKLMSKGRERFVTFSREARRALERYLNANGGPTPQMLPHPVKGLPLFLSSKGNRMQKQTAQKWFGRLTEQVLGKRYTPHCLRHSSATHLIEGGAPLELVQEMLGHERASMTLHYQHVTKEHQKRHVEGQNWR